VAVDATGQLTVTADVADFAAPTYLESQWQAMILAGALSDQDAANGAAPLQAVHIVLESPDGSQDDLGGGLGNVAHNQGFVSY
jgi:hypothetical protein